MIENTNDTAIGGIVCIYIYNLYAVLADVYDFFYYHFPIETSLSFGAKGHHAIIKSEKRVVFSKPHIAPGQYDGPALANNNRTGLRLLSGIKLCAEIFWI